VAAAGLLLRLVASPGYCRSLWEQDALGGGERVIENGEKTEGRARGNEKKMKNESQRSRKFLSFGGSRPLGKGKCKESEPQW